MRAAPGVLLVPLQQDLRLERRHHLAAPIASTSCCSALTGPFVAALMQTIGIRRTILIGAGAAAGGRRGSALRDGSRGSLYLTWGVLVGLGAGATGFGVAATIANRWFVARRGLVMGLLTASNASGQLVFLPVLARLVERRTAGSACRSRCRCWSAP